MRRGLLLVAASALLCTACPTEPRIFYTPLLNTRKITGIVGNDGTPGASAVATAGEVIRVYGISEIDNGSDTPFTFNTSTMHASCSEGGENQLYFKKSASKTYAPENHKITVQGKTKKAVDVKVVFLCKSNLKEDTTLDIIGYPDAASVPSTSTVVYKSPITASELP